LLTLTLTLTGKNNLGELTDMYPLNLTLFLQLTIILTLTPSLTLTLRVKVFTRCGAKAEKSKPGKLTWYGTVLGIVMQKQTVP